MPNKKNRSKMKRMKKRPYQVGISPEPNPGRRNMIKLVGGLGALLALGIPTSIVFLNKGDEKKWVFLDTRSHPNYRHLQASDQWEEIVRQYVPLGPEKKIHPNSPKFQEIKAQTTSLIINKIQEYGWDPRGSYHPEVLQQDFGVPEQAVFSDSAIEYIEIANQFMHDQIRGLIKFEIDWTPIVLGDNFSDNSNGKGFVGRGSYSVQKVIVISSSHPNERIVIGSTVFDHGGYGSLSMAHNENNPDFSLFISVNETAINTAFSEVFPLTTHPVTMAYANRRGIESYRLAKLADEALAEGISYHLGLQIVDQLGIPNGKPLVEKFREGLTKRPEYYAFVPNSISWIGKNGIQQAFDLYMESPEKYMKAIAS